MRKNFLLILLFLFVSNIRAQKNVAISSFTIKESISKADPVDPDLGRYDAYELNVDKNDRIAFLLKAEKFQPFLLLVSPSKKSALKTPKGNSNVVLFDTVASERGNWEFYILADSNAAGNYQCTVAFAKPEALVLPAEENFCSKIKYLFNQADGDFLFIKKGNELKELFPKLKTYEFKGNVLTLKFSTETANFENIKTNLKNCLGKKFYSEGMPDGIKFVENVFKDRHFVSISRGSKEVIIKVGKEK